MRVRVLKFIIFLLTIVFLSFFAFLPFFTDNQSFISHRNFNRPFQKKIIFTHPSIKKLCPERAPGLVGTVPVHLNVKAETMPKLEEMFPSIDEGHGRPEDCIARHKVAVIIPYRDREYHLRVFLLHMHDFLTKQQLDYGIYIVQQKSNQTFNRAKLMNVGFVEANDDYEWQCYIFHDVDLLPENDNNLYSCPCENPRHMSVAVDKFKYSLPYGTIFGGVTAVTRQQFLKINGYSNSYWGWGGEDDDMSARVHINEYKIARYPTHIARYKMIRHGIDKGNKPNSTCTKELMKRTRERWKMDGLNTLNYTRLERIKYKLYTLISADLHEGQGRNQLRKELIC